MTRPELCNNADRMTKPHDGRWGFEHGANLVASRSTRSGHASMTDVGWPGGRVHQFKWKDRSKNRHKNRGLFVCVP